MPTLNGKSNGRRGNVPPGVFLTEDGRLPGFAQRRLDDLIAKKKTVGLTKPEERELAEALEYIDGKSIEMLAYEASREGLPRVGSPRKKSKRAGRR